MLVELLNIHKHFGPVKAVDGVSLTVTPGEILGILGENGAGKSTLMKILSGAHRKTGGTIRFDGTCTPLSSPAPAVSLGIGMVYQDPYDFPALTVLDNYMLGTGKGFLRRRHRMESRLGEGAARFGYDLDPHRSVDSLTIGQRQQLEILRLVSLGVQVFILDEPTTGLSDPQKAHLFRILRKLAQDGKSIVFVSHRIADAEGLCDRVTVLRRGLVSGSVRKPFDSDQLVTMIFGAPNPMPSPGPGAVGSTILELENIAAAGGRAGLVVSRQCLRRGEVVGLVGLAGSGRGTFLRLAAGIQRPDEGRVVLRGEDMTRKGYHAFRRQGVAFMPAARLEEGLMRGLSISEHALLGEAPGTTSRRRANALAAAGKRIGRFRIAGRPGSMVETLSGGNQQRLLLSLLPAKPGLLLLEHPTRGLDMDAVNWTWEHLLSLCGTGTGLVFSSSELDELLQVADRVLVFFDGRIVTDAPANDLDMATLGQAIAGVKPLSD